MTCFSMKGPFQMVSAIKAKKGIIFFHCKIATSGNTLPGEKSVVDVALPLIELLRKNPH